MPRTAGSQQVGLYLHNEEQLNGIRHEQNSNLDCYSCDGSCSDNASHLQIEFQTETECRQSPL